MIVPIEEMQEGFAYLIDARNACVGVWNAKLKGFTIARYKLGDTYLANEYHWDTGAPYGTTNPFERLSEVPSEYSEDQLVTYLTRLERLHSKRVIEYRHAYAKRLRILLNDS